MSSLRERARCGSDGRSRRTTTRRSKIHAPFARDSPKTTPRRATDVPANGPWTATTTTHELTTVVVRDDHGPPPPSSNGRRTGLNHLEVPSARGGRVLSSFRRSGQRRRRGLRIPAISGRSPRIVSLRYSLVERTRRRRRRLAVRVGGRENLPCSFHAPVTSTVWPLERRSRTEVQRF